MLTDTNQGIGALLASSTAATQKPKTGAAALLDTIENKGGFAAYAKDIQDKKIEELRKKILAEMGLSEEDLAKMSAEQRANIEKIVNQEVQKRLEALNAKNPNDPNAVTNTSGITSGTPSASASTNAAQQVTPVAGAGTSGGGGLSIGSALLQVLSDARNQEEAQGTDAQSDPSKTRQKLPNA